REAGREARAPRHAGGGAGASRAGAVLRRCRRQADRAREGRRAVPGEGAMRTYGTLVLIVAAAAGAAAEVPARPAPQAAPMKSPTSDVAPPGPSAGERARRLLDDALLALTTARRLGPPDSDVIARFRAAAEAAKDSAPALLGGEAAGAQAAARRILALDPQDVDALCALGRAHLALGSPGTAKVLALRAAQIDKEDARPLLLEAEVARARGDAAAEMMAVRAAAAADQDSPEAALALGRALFERGQTGE